MRAVNMGRICRKMSVIFLVLCATVPHQTFHVVAQRNNGKDKRFDRANEIDEKVLRPVNGDFDNILEDLNEHFEKGVPSFRSSSVIKPSGSVEIKQAEKRALGGFVLDLGQFSDKDGQVVPSNVFGTSYTSHLIDDSCQSLGFPYVCSVRKLVEKQFKCPVDVPYCQRIPCNNNPGLHRDARRCLKQPGCCFDQVLFNYRKYYGETVLPQVPVCHMAVRNEHFHNMARRFAQRYRGWNPLLTSCLIKSNRNEIERNSIECSTLDIFEYFGYNAKHAGWSDILPKECGLIGGCWRQGMGCFYPPRITNLKLRSTYNHPRARPYSPFDLYGQPMCLPMDPYASSGNLLDQYHQCLASGCEIDPAVTRNVILNHLYNVSSELPSHLVNSFKYEILLGTVRPDNWKTQIENFKKYGKLHPDAFTPRQGGPNAKANLPTHVLAQLDKFPGPKTPTYQRSGMLTMNQMNFRRSSTPYPQTPLNPFQQISKITSAQGIYSAPPSQFHYPNPNAFISSQTWSQSQFPGTTSQQSRQGSYMYAETASKIRLYPVPCPFKIVRIPNFPPLDGKVTGCCDRNLCYVPRNTARRQYSGAAAYWGPWGFWSKCSASCNNPVQKRYRTCIGPNPTSCSGPNEDKRACYGVPNCQARFSMWSQWSECNRECKGERMRHRYCVMLPCEGKTQERERCGTKCEKRSSRRDEDTDSDSDSDDDRRR